MHRYPRIPMFPGARYGPSFRTCILMALTIIQTPDLIPDLDDEPGMTPEFCTLWEELAVLFCFALAELFHKVAGGLAVLLRHCWWGLRSFAALAAMAGQRMLVCLQRCVRRTRQVAPGIMACLLVYASTAVMAICRLLVVTWHTLVACMVSGAALSVSFVKGVGRDIAATVRSVYSKRQAGNSKLTSPAYSSAGVSAVGPVPDTVVNYAAASQPAHSHDRPQAQHSQQSRIHRQQVGGYSGHPTNPRTGHPSKSGIGASGPSGKENMMTARSQVGYPVQRSPLRTAANPSRGSPRASRSTTGNPFYEVGRLTSQGAMHGRTVPNNDCQAMDRALRHNRQGALPGSTTSSPLSAYRPGR